MTRILLNLAVGAGAVALAVFTYVWFFGAPTVRIQATDAAGKVSFFAFTVRDPRPWPQLQATRTVGWENGAPADASDSQKWPAGEERHIASLTVTADGTVEEALVPMKEALGDGAGGGTLRLTSFAATTSTEYEVVAITPTGTASTVWIVRDKNWPSKPLPAHSYHGIGWTRLPSSATPESAVGMAAEALAGACYR